MKLKILLVFMLVATAVAAGFAGGFYYSDRYTRRRFDLQDQTSALTLKQTLDLGREIFDHTPRYVGPEGTMRKQPANGMTCKNCHLDSGTRKFGLPLVFSHGKFPNTDARTGRVITLADRINSCIQRPMASTPLPVDSPEMIALLTYLRFIAAGKKILWRNPAVRELEIPITYLDRPASPERGRKVYRDVCARCHQPNGQGLRLPGQIEYVYPPLWGSNSYSEGSSMQRVIVLARFVKANMPYGTTPDNPALTDEQAFDVAAFINSNRYHSRPPVQVYASKRPDLKPIDFPFGPFVDPFPEEQHRYGPFPPIFKWHAERSERIIE